MLIGYATQVLLKLIKRDFCGGEYIALGLLKRNLVELKNKKQKKQQQKKTPAQIQNARLALARRISILGSAKHTNPCFSWYCYTVVAFNFLWLLKYIIVYQRGSSGKGF